MKKINAMKGAALNSRQQGFTIIELVVVILLLGILTATALPRFIDVTDDARDAVRDATAGGLRTGLALIRAQAVAEGTTSGNAPLNGDYNLTVDGNGYPLLANGCSTIYTGLLQTGATPATSGNSGAQCLYTLTDVSRQLLLDPAGGSVIAL